MDDELDSAYDLPLGASRPGDVAPEAEVTASGVELPPVSARVQDLYATPRGSHSHQHQLEDDMCEFTLRIPLARRLPGSRELVDRGQLERCSLPELAGRADFEYPSDDDDRIDLFYMIDDTLPYSLPDHIRQRSLGTGEIRGEYDGFTYTGSNGAGRSLELRYRQGAKWHDDPRPQVEIKILAGYTAEQEAKIAVDELIGTAWEPVLRALLAEAIYHRHHVIASHLNAHSETSQTERMLEAELD